MVSCADGDTQLPVFHKGKKVKLFWFSEKYALFLRENVLSISLLVLWNWWTSEEYLEHCWAVYGLQMCLKMILCMLTHVVAMYLFVVLVHKKHCLA